MAAKSAPAASSLAGVLMSSIQVAGFLAAPKAAAPSPSASLSSLLPYKCGTPGMACGYARNTLADPEVLMLRKES